MTAKTLHQYVLDFLPGQDPHGAPAITVVCKRGYRIDTVEALAVPLEEQPLILGTEEYFDGGKPGEASIRLDTDLRPFKEKVDVIVVGRGIAPHGIPVPTFDVSVRLGRVERSVRVVGPRYASWNPQKKGSKGKRPPFVVPSISDPEPIAELPLRYEYAFGGNAPYISPEPEAFAAALEAQEEKVEAEKAEREAKEAEEKKQAFEGARAEALQAFSEEAKATDYFSNSGESGIVDGEHDGPGVAVDGTQILTPEALAEQERENIEAAEKEEKRAPKGEEVVSDSVLEVHEPSLEDGEAKVLRTERGTQVFNLEAEGEIQLTDEGWVEASQSSVKKVQATPSEDPFAEFPKIPYPSNPVGMGFASCREERVFEGLALPLLEHLDHPIGAENLLREMEELLEEGPRPGGFGVLGGGWMPRSQYAGVPKESVGAMEDMREARIVELDPEKEEDRAELEGLLNFTPPLFQPQWYNAAVPEWQLDRVDGNEEIVVRNMTENGTLFFRLPGDRPKVTLDRGKGEELVSMRIDTLSLLVDEEEIHLVWRGQLPYGGEEELTEYPRLELSVCDAEHEEQEEAEILASGDGAVPYEGGTQILSVEDLEEKKEKPSSNKSSHEDGVALDSVRDEEGTLREDRTGDVRHGDEAWVEEAQGRMDDSQDAALKKAERDERSERKEEVAGIRERLAAIQVEEAKKKKKKPSKSSSKGKK